MKTEKKPQKIFELKTEYVEYMPEVKEEGILYVSERFSLAIHKCCCGCGIDTVTDLKPYWEKGWSIKEEEGKITLRPSIGNFNGERPYHAHYYITKGEVQWL